MEKEEISLPWKEPYWIKYISYFPQKNPVPRDPEDWANHLRVRARKEKLSRKTFYLWQKRFKEGELSSLEERSRAPQRKRAWQMTPEEEFRIIKLRKENLRWGKMKLALLYQKRYGERISSF